MRDTLLFIQIIIVYFYLTGCDSAIKYPDGGYDYPQEINPKDTSFYFYPIKDLQTARDSFRTAYYSPIFFHSFNEPNLCLKPQKNIVFRLSYEEWQQQPVVILLTDNTIIVKKGNSSEL